MSQRNKRQNILQEHDNNKVTVAIAAGAVVLFIYLNIVLLGIIGWLCLGAAIVGFAKPEIVDWLLDKL